MAGGNLAAGISLVVGVLAVLWITEYVESQGNQINEAPSGFEDSFDIGTIEGAPTVVSGFYAFAMGTALLAGIVLVAAGIVGTPAGGG